MDFVNAGQAEAFRVQAGSSDIAGLAHVYIDSRNAAHMLIVGLYSNGTSGHPATLLSTGSIATVQPGAWNSVSLTPTALVSGHTYWLAVLGEQGTLRYRDRERGTCSSETSSQTNLGALSVSWKTGRVYVTCPVSAYVTAAAAVFQPPAPVEPTPVPPLPAPVEPTPAPVPVEPPPVEPAPVKPANETLPSITGTTTEGQTLSATHGTWNGSPTSYGYQWQDCNTIGSSCVNVSGASGTSYTLAATDAGHTMRVVVTATSIAGSTSTSSAASSVVASVPPPPPPPPAAPTNTTAPSIAGTTTEGQVLSAATGTWSGSPTSLSYQWQDCNISGEACSNVAGATSATHKLLASDVGHSLRVVVTASNAGGATSATSAFTGAIQPLASPPSPPENTIAPSVSGNVQVGQSLVSSSGSWSGTAPISFTYKWQDCNASGEACSNIAGASANEYKLVEGDAGHTVRVVVTAANAAGSSQASSVATATVSLLSASCNTTVTSTMSANAIANAIGSAANGSTVCMEGGTYPAITVSGAKHSSYVTVRPKGEAHVIASNWEIVNSSYLRFEKLESTEFGFRTRLAINHIQWIDNKFTGYRGLVVGGTNPSEDILIEGNTFEKLVPKGTETSTCTTTPGIGEGQGVTLEYVENNITISHNRFKEVAWHYIQGGADTTVDNNSFEGPIPTLRNWGELGGGCTHLNVWQIFDGSENDTFNDNIVRGEPGAPAAVTPILFEHGVPSKEGPYPCSDLYTNITVEGNLFVNASTADVVDIANTNNLIYSRNTVVGGQYGTWLDRSDVCGPGTNLIAEHNIAVDTWSAGAPQRFVLGECTGSCKFDYNVSDDGTANAGGSAHYVTKWSPTWESIAYGTPGLYMATDLPFTAGYQGNVGP